MIILLLPLAFIALALLVKSPLVLSWLNIVNNLVIFVLVLILFSQISQQTISSTDFFLYDPLSGFSIMLVSFISLLVSLYSLSYFHTLEEQALVTKKHEKSYYIFLNLFIGTMLAASLLNNIGWVWIAIEGTTLSSALLLGLYSKSKLLEAAWKYAIICTVGIFLALLGIVLFATSITNTGITNLFSISILNGSDVVFNATLLKIAFVFIFIGYGTKVGLAPMHTWMPDVYGSADSPVSALLTAALSPAVLIPILRFKHIVDSALVSHDFTNGLFYFFGAATVLSAAVFLVNQSDYKRLLAYSSMENTGLVVLAVAVGSQVILVAAFLHIVFHSLTKVVLFLCCGNLYLNYQSSEIDEVRGVMRRLPLTGRAMMAGVFAIIGLPPMALFISKFMIIRELIDTNLLLASSILVAFAIVFGSFIHYFNKILFFKGVTEDRPGLALSFAFANFIAIAIPLCLLIYFGLFLPEELIVHAQKMAEVLL